MAHKFDPNDPYSVGYGHTIGEAYPQVIENMFNKSSKDSIVVRPGEAQSFVKNQNNNAINGVSDTSENNFKGLGALDGTLGQYIPQAQNIYNSLYSKSKEQQEKEDRMNTGMMMLNFFTKMGAEASRPGATALGAASVAGADTASMYIKKVNADRARKDAEKKGVVGLATQLMGKDKTTGTPKAYNVLNPTIVNRLFGTKLKQNDKISLTAKQFNQLPIGSVADYSEPKSQKRVPIYKVDDGTSKMVIEFGNDYNTNLDSGSYTTVKPIDKKAPTVYEDSFGEKRFLTGPNEGQLVSDVMNAKKVESNENIEGEIINEDETVSTDKPQLKRLTKIEMGYVKQYRSEIEKLTKDFRDIQGGYQKIVKFYETKGSIGDYGLAVQFAKLIDPGSVAREGEVSAVQRSGSLSDRVKADIINVINGMGNLPPRTRAGIYNRAIEIFNVERVKAVDIINKFKGFLSADLRDDKQGGRLDFFTVGQEVPLSDLVDLTKLKEIDRDFVYNEEKIKKMSVKELTDIVSFQSLSTEQLQFIKKLVKKKKAD